jgi:uncharacterized protein (TIGR02145 family)
MYPQFKKLNQKNNLRFMKKTNFVFVLVLSLAMIVSSCKNKDCDKLVLNSSTNGTTVTLTTVGGKTPYKYSKDGSNYQDNAVFENLVYGDYTFYTKDANDCEKSITTSFTNLKDKDENIYKTVKIGNQIWMAENLKVSVTTGSAVCYEDASFVSQADSCEKYGKLYDYTAATSACPTGWHLPTDEEWQTLEISQGMTAVDVVKEHPDQRGVVEKVGKKLQKGGSSGFDIILNGNCYNNVFDGYDQENWLWTSTQKGTTGTYYTRAFGKNNGHVTRFPSDLKGKYSIRCIKD